MKPWNWVLLAVPAVGLAELGAHVHFRDAAPSPAEYGVVADALRATWQPDTLVVAAPYWTEPNLRAVVGDDLLTLADVARADDSPYQRALEVSLPGADSDLSAGGHGAPWRARHGDGKAPSRWELTSTRKVGKFEVRVWENPSPEKVLLNFIDALTPEQAQVNQRRGNALTPCPWNDKAKVSNGALHGHPTFPRQRFDCKGDDEFVGETVIEDEDYRPRRCLWAKPPRHKELVIHFDKVQLGGALKGYGGLPWFLERESHGPKIELRVEANGQELGTFVHKDGEGWKPFAYDTSALAGQEVAVDFVVSSSGTRDRQFCFQADVREAL